MELPHIGQHCSLENCKALDFLPILCPSCQQAFCNEHRFALDHSCPGWAKVDKQLVQCSKCQNLVRAPDNMSYEEALKAHEESGCVLHCYVRPLNSVDPCAVKGCKDMDYRIGPVHCDGCTKGYCLRHRHPSTHGCVGLDANEEIKEERRAAAQAQLEKIFEPSKQQPASKQTVSKPAPQKKKSVLVEKMKIKAKAKGDTSVPLSMRIYIFVQYPQETKMAPAPMFFDKSHRVGRLLDMIAETCQVKNDNNRLAVDDGQRLEIFNALDMSVLNKSVGLEKVLSDLDTVLLERKSKVLA
ncbi:hypothetical protein CLU79DRAFT_735692 [Phycomyces nitens]|nr:hypothetical protein CLU79DRAFT_735692 [Phycomyces nitens]